MRTRRDRVSLPTLSSTNGLVTSYRDFCPMLSASDASSFGESYGIHSLLCTRTSATTTRRDAMWHSLRRNVTLWPVSSNQGPVLPWERWVADSFLKPRFSEDLPGNRYDNTGSSRCCSSRWMRTFCVEWIVSRPLHGHFPCDREKFFGGSRWRSPRGKCLWNFSRRNAMRLSASSRDKTASSQVQLNVYRCNNQ